MQQIDDVGLGFEIGEQQADALEILRRRSKSPIRLAWPRTISCWRAPPAPGPERQPRIDEPRGQFVDLVRAASRARSIFAARLGERAAARMRR